MGSTYQTPQYQLGLAAVVFLLLAATVYAGAERPVDPSTRIQGGKKVSITKYPWVVALENSHRRVCGGVVISKRWVVTAAHCIDGSKIYIMSSTSRTMSYGRVHSINRTIVHPKYDKVGLDYDIALVETKRPFKWTKKLKPASLAKKNPDAGTWTTAVSWAIRNNTVGEVLYAADMRIQDWNECRVDNYMTERKICTIKKSKSITEGDSGGSLTIHGMNQLVGICSSVNRRKPPTLTSIFTSIASLRGWIKKNAGV